MNFIGFLRTFFWTTMCTAIPTVTHKKPNNHIIIQNIHDLHELQAENATISTLLETFPKQVSNVSKRVHNNRVYFYLFIVGFAGVFTVIQMAFALYFVLVHWYNFLQHIFKENISFFFH